MAKPLFISEEHVAKIMMACGALIGLAKVAIDERYRTMDQRDDRLKSINSQLITIEKILAGILKEITEEKEK